MYPLWRHFSHFLRLFFIQIIERWTRVCLDIRNLPEFNKKTKLENKVLCNDSC